MKVLLLGGNDNSGKTETLVRLHSWLVDNKGFSCNTNTHDKNQGDCKKDFICYLKRTSGTIKRVILNTATDNISCIQTLEKFIDNLILHESLLENKDDLLLITAIRNVSDIIRNKLLNSLKQKFGISESGCIEIPVAHIYRASPSAIKWYEKIDEIIHIVLESQKIGL